MLKLPKARTRYLYDKELQSVLDACAGDPLMDAAIRVSIASGLRKSELLRLTWSDIDLTGKHSAHGPRLLVPTSKNEEMRSIYLPSSAVAALETLRSQRVVGTQGFIAKASRSPSANWIGDGNQFGQKRSCRIFAGTINDTRRRAS